MNVRIEVWLGHEIRFILKEIEGLLPKDKGHLIMELDSEQASLASLHQETGY
jgi:hypothetical protein